jgi:heme exporter protein C
MKNDSSHTFPPTTIGPEGSLNVAFIAFVVLTVGLLAYSTYQGLVVAPTEQTMGEVQRIFYYHVPSAWTAGVCFFVNFVASAVYLEKNRRYAGPLLDGLVQKLLLKLVATVFRVSAAQCDALAAASAEVGVTFCTIVLITGPIWARPVWGIWWTWDARLTTTLVLWLIYVSYLVLRRFAAGGQQQVLAAALAVFGFVDVPIVYMSIRWFRTQHPSPVMGGGENSGLDPAMLHAFFWNLAAFTCVGIVLMVVRYRLQMLEEEVEAMHAAAALQGGTQ